MVSFKRLPFRKADLLAEYLLTIATEKPSNRLHYEIRALIVFHSSKLIKALKPASIVGLVNVFVSKDKVSELVSGLQSFVNRLHDRKYTVRVLANILMKVLVLPYLYLIQKVCFLKNQEDGQYLNGSDYNMLLDLPSEPLALSNHKELLVAQMQHFCDWYNTKGGGISSSNISWPYAIEPVVLCAELRRKQKRLISPALKRWVRGQKRERESSEKDDLEIIFKVELRSESSSSQHFE